MDALLAIAQKITRMERRLAALETREYTQAVAGSWTPADESGATLSLTVTDATYIKIGRLVIAMFALTYPVTASGLTAVVGGLPFTCVSSTSNSWPAVISVQNYGAEITGLVTKNSDQFRFINSAASALTNANMSNKIARGAAMYLVA